MVCRERDLNPGIFLTGKRRFTTRTQWHNVVWTGMDLVTQKEKRYMKKCVWISFFGGYDAPYFSIITYFTFKEKNISK